MWVKFIHNVCESKSCPNDNADSKDKHKINTRRHAQWYGWDHILIPVNFVCLIMRTWDKDSFHCIQYGITLEIIISIIFLIQIVLWGTYQYTGIRRRKILSLWLILNVYSIMVYCLNMNEFSNVCIYLSSWQIVVQIGLCRNIYVFDSFWIWVVLLFEQ